MININITILICLLCVIIEHLHIEYMISFRSILCIINLFGLYYILQKISIKVIINYND
jgi:hypothetical protein